jgi:hypothetical protein
MEIVNILQFCVKSILFTSIHTNLAMVQIFEVISGRFNIDKVFISELLSERKIVIN